MGQEEIAYQNKDITSKVLAENFKGKTFRVYGLDLPEIREARPTDIPAIRANELRMDNLFELEDDTVAILDYESDYDKNDKVKYLNYLTGVANRYQKEKRGCPQLRMVVIYTGDISRGQQVFTLAGILAFTDKIIDRETANKIRRAIEMTQVAMIFEEEKQQAVEAERKKAADLLEAERKKAAASEKQVVEKMLKKGYSTEEIVFLVSNYSEKDVEALRKNL